MLKSEKLSLLSSLLKQKKSKSFYAKRLNITENEVESLIQELKNNSSETVKATYSHNLEKGEFEFTGFYKQAPTPEQIIKDHKIDITKWKLVSFWSKEKSNGYVVSAFFKNISKEEQASNNFTEFIKNYKSPHNFIPVIKTNEHQPKACLIFNMQDAHWNKYDIDGKNNMNNRFVNVFNKVQHVIEKASYKTTIDKTIYVLGSDQFNNEFTGTTTKGTPQASLFTYEEGFKKISDYEIKMISYLLTKSKFVEVVYVPGNHDHFVGWHLVQFLAAYFRNQTNLKFDISQEATKYKRYKNTAMQFNHGDVLKAEKLAQIFPMDFKKEWSSCDHYLSFVGDKHHEVAKDLNGIKFYQLPALSTAKSTWDDKQGFSCKGEMRVFLISEKDGINAIYHEKL